LVNAIPYAALQRGLLTVEKKGKKNVYNGRILEIQGLPNLTVGRPSNSPMPPPSAPLGAAPSTCRKSPWPSISAPTW